MPPESALEPVAAIDLGTHSALLLVACRGEDGVLLELAQECRNPRLGEGLAADGAIAPRAAERAVGVLADFLARARDLGVEARDLRAVGTAVLRRASNAGAFGERARSELGRRVEVLSEEEEARLGWRAARLAGAGPGAVVLDAGGGSTELVFEGGRERRSVPAGAVVLTETWMGLGGRPPRREGGWPALVRAARELVGGLPQGVASAGGEPALPAVVLGGTATNLACLELELEAFDHRRAEGAVVPAASALRQAERLAALSLAERRALPVEAERVEVLPAGLACLGAALERVGAKEARVSGRGLRFGVALELLERA